ncbi:CdaR family protein [Halalkalibacter urbisdiaboli]|uniref:CdaR family protein n=1 Tax=Halalkalibacter urbisdiaboli TaxID=1960589 RepID=UPI000B44B97C|nr:CdaR family protein [Halalkalibacter urbisdiaboli]
MDKLFNSHWFVKIISFFIALMLFTMVNLDNISSQPGVLPSLSEGSYTLEEVELTVLYDEENYSVTDKTEHVQVNLRGPQSVLTYFQLIRPTYEIFVDVTEREAGVHTLSVQHRGFPSELTVSVVPQFVRVELQEKQTISLPVHVDLINSNEIEEGYTVGTPIVTPMNVEVTAAREVIASVASAKAYVDVSGADKMMEEAVPVKLFDEAGNELHLNVNPSIVDVKIPITSPNKRVPVKVPRDGTLPTGLSIESFEINPTEVTIYGPSEVIDKINVIEGTTINLNEITESQTIDVHLPVPKGVERIDPEKVQVTIEVAEEESIEWTDVPIEIIGANQNVNVNFAEDQAPMTGVTIYGSQTLLDKLTLNDIQAFIDVSDKSIGDHELPVQFNGPPNLRFVSEKEKAKVSVTSRSE